MKLYVIACEVLARELYFAAARARHACNVTLLEQGLHDNSDLCRDHLQGLVDAARPDRCDAVLLGYGLCSNSLAGLRAGAVPLVVPRAHDCITLLLGSKERYAALFAEEPGTYWFSSGWVECRAKTGDRVEPRQNSGLGPAYRRAEFQDLVARYGEENARYLAEFMGAWQVRYKRGCLIDFPFARHLDLEGRVRAICRERGWAFARVEGDLGLVQAGLDGAWDEARFLRLGPGETVRASFDDLILAAARPEACAAPAPPAGRTPCR